MASYHPDSKASPAPCPSLSPQGLRGQAGTWVTDLRNRLTGLFWVKGPFPSLHQFPPQALLQLPPSLAHWPCFSNLWWPLCLSQQEPPKTSWSEGATDCMCPLPQSLGRDLTPTVTVVTGGPLGRWSGHKGGAVPLERNPQRGPSPLPPCEDMARRQLSMKQEVGSHQTPNLWIFGS